jgi:hypothetical protein
VLHALREENRWHHHGGGDVNHSSKRALLAALNPGDTEWRRAAAGHGCDLVYRAMRLL